MPVDNRYGGGESPIKGAGDHNLQGKHGGDPVLKGPGDETPGTDAPPEGEFDMDKDSGIEETVSPDADGA